MGGHTKKNCIGCTVKFAKRIMKIHIVV
jgi:hypothetical protein